MGQGKAHYNLGQICSLQSAVLVLNVSTHYQYLECTMIGIHHKKTIVGHDFLKCPFCALSHCQRIFILNLAAILILLHL